ncbi:MULTISPECIES: hypothetical protein [Staphylococcus]|uniref:Uncharacterized protein n=1 Tax=Staphylococcus hyicus TaxID=1284 RepID=A0ACD5FP09_STAHY|nr:MULTISPECIES: hypothetical protein [Staphylococcus]MCQ9301357.1 hypothetical protein [Staphylococcus hyicus]MDG4943974.1 hypothetical protein [Staphylococcus agnetis]MDP4462645.1 hypothetical protein [Staphylococcus hyicus]
MKENKNNFHEYFQKNSKVITTSLSRHNLSSLFHTSRTSLDSISSNDLAKWLENPNVNYKHLINLSRLLYKSSGEYRSMLNYFIKMARFYHVIDPIHDNTSKINSGKVKKDLAKISLQINKMNIKHELAKVFKTCVIEDVFFGYEIEDNDNYFIYKLDPNYCKIIGLADGMYIYAFNLAYFEGNEHLLQTFPDEFANAYKIMKINGGNNWFEPDFTKSVCFKFNENDPEIFPPFSVMFEPLIELNDYKKLKKAGAKINNYMLLHQKVPMHDNSNKDYQADNFAISPDAMDYFNSMVNESLPDEIGAIVSPMEINPIKLDKDDKNDKVLEATRDVYNASGVSSFIFNNDKNSTGGLQYSTRKDELLVIDFYRQVERWLNRKIRFGNLTSKNQWKITLLNVTGMNEDRYLELLTKSGTLGFAVRGRIAAMHGQDYHTLLTSLELENEVLDLDTKMIPLASSHTGGINQAIDKHKNTEDSKGGRPQKDSSQLTDSGQANKDSSDGKTPDKLNKGGENSDE